jgi:MFS transporter, PPP family, 3-phenylpropionic acid transporter
MPHNPQIPTGTAFAWRLGIFYVALFVALGVQLPFLPVWFAAKGLTAGEIGVLLALPMIVRVFAIPLAARRADRRDALHATILLAALAAAAAHAVVGLAAGFIAIMAAFAVASVFYTPIMPLTDAYAMRGLQARGRAYGPVRLWGSAAFIAGSFVAGLALDLIAAVHLIWLVVAALGLAAVAAAGLAPLFPHGPAATRPATRAKARALLRDPAFLAITAASSLIQASHAVYYGFSALDWRAAGLGGGTIAALWALGVVAEIALFAVSGRLRIGSPTLLLVGAAGATIRWTAMAFDPPQLLLPLLQCLHALSFGATHLAALAFVVRAAPAEIGATAQGYLAVAQGLAMAGAMGISGVLYARYGGAAYGAMALAAGAGGVCALIGGRLWRRGTAP